MKSAFWTILLLSTWAVCGASPSPPANLRINVALGARYELEPSPDYSLCTDPDDLTQLTDGAYVKGHFWSQQGTVGWQATSLVTITIDLKQSQPIAGMSFNTAAGTGGGFSWPAGILVLVSEDGTAWNYAGDLVSLGWKTSVPALLTNYAVHSYSTMNLATRGRFVKLAVVPSLGFAFVDEIEFYPGPMSLMTQPAPGPSVTDMNAFLNAGRIDACLRRRLRYDLSAIADELASGALSGTLSAPLKNEIDAIAAAIPSIWADLPDSLSTVFPINDVHRRMFAVQAGIWRAKGLSGVVLWQSNRWDMLSPTDIPIPGSPVLNVPMMNNEYRADAFNLSNTSETNVQIFLSVQDLPGEPSSYVRVHEVPFTDTQLGVPVAAALVQLMPQAGRYEVRIPPGLTRQVWFTFHPTNVPAGIFTGRVLLECAGVTNQVPIQLKIYPFRFPDQPTLHLAGWDYIDRDRIYDLTPDNRDALIRILREHFVDSPWATLDVLATGKYDTSGKMIQTPAPAAFRTWLDRWPNVRNYCVFVNVSPSFAGLAMGTPAFQQAVADWINWWVQQLTQWNIQPRQLSIQLVDEPRSPQQDQIIIEYATIIHQAQPDVIIWEDPLWSDPSDGTPEMFEVTQVLCPHLPTWLLSGTNFATFYLQQQQSGRRLWFYSASGSRLLDPYFYYRLQPWFCWKYGAEGSAFWSFVDSNGSSSWNEYGSQRGAYTPLFLDAQTVTESKHLEAIREGVEDHEYLRLLRDRLQEFGNNPTNLAIASALTLLQTAASETTSNTVTYLSQQWSTQKDRSVADRVRVDILDAMTRLLAQ